MLLLNKYLLSHSGFKQPVFLTLCHMTACTFLVGGALCGDIVTYTYHEHTQTHARPPHHKPTTHTHDHIHSWKQNRYVLTQGGVIALTGIYPAKPIKSKIQFAKLTVLSIIFCLTIVLGNASLRFIPVSFNQAIGATTPFFTAILALLLQGAKETPLTYASLVPIAGGVIIASGK